MPVSVLYLSGACGRRRSRENRSRDLLRAAEGGHGRGHERRSGTRGEVSWEREIRVEDGNDLCRVSFMEDLFVIQDVLDVRNRNYYFPRGVEF